MLKNTPAFPDSAGQPLLVAGGVRRAAVFIVLVLLLLAPAAAPASEGGVAWLGYGQAAELARHTPRPIVLFFSAPWCYLCKKMQRLVFSDPELAERLGREAYPVLVDITLEPRLMEIYEIKQVPTTILLDTHGKPALRLTGYQNRSTLDRALRFVGQGHHRRGHWKDFSSLP